MAFLNECNDLTDGKAKKKESGNDWWIIRQGIFLILFGFVFGVSTNVFIAKFLTGESYAEFIAFAVSTAASFILGAIFISTIKR